MKVNGVFVMSYMELDVMENEIPDEPKAGEVLIRTMACGVYCWDSWLYRDVNAPGPMPYMIGREDVGIAEKMGSLVTNVKKGDKVFAAYGGNDMTCEYLTNRKDDIMKSPDDATDQTGAVYEPTCCAVNLLNIADIEMDDHVVLTGAGHMGTLILMGLTRNTQARKITVFELREGRRETVRGLNSTEILDPRSEEGKWVIKEIQDRGGVDVVIDFGAPDSGSYLADPATKMAGKFAIGSFRREDVIFNETKRHLGSLTVYNLSPFSNVHYPDMIPRAHTMIEKDVFEPTKFVTHTVYSKDAQGMEDMFQRVCDRKDSYIKGAVLFYED